MQETAIGITTNQNKANKPFQHTFIKHQSMPIRTKNQSLPKSGGFKIDKNINIQPLNKTSNRQAFLGVRKQNVPGPGEYDVKFPEKQKLGLIMKESFENKLYQVIHGPPVPGPGFYNTPSVFDGNSKLIKNRSSITFAPPRLKRFHQVKQFQTPGPGYYDSGHKKQKERKFLLSTYNSSAGGFLPKSKKVTSMVQQNNNPGPGAYPSEDYFAKLKQKKKPIIEFKFVHGHPS